VLLKEQITEARPQAAQKDHPPQITEEVYVCNGCGQNFETLSSPITKAKIKAFEILSNIVSESLLLNL